MFAPKRNELCFRQSNRETWTPMRCEIGARQYESRRKFALSSGEISIRRRPERDGGMETVGYRRDICERQPAKERSLPSNSSGYVRTDHDVRVADALEPSIILGGCLAADRS
jgi:hypothetical protein